MISPSTLARSRPKILRIACVLLCTGLAALGLFFVFNGGLNADEGFYLLASRLVSEGQRPYADFGFTQTPLVPYANLPWLHLFGFDLLGLRLAGLMWTTAAVMLGVVALYRKGWATPAAFAFLLLTAPGWMEFAVKGKTYAVAGFAVMLGAIAICSDWSLRKRWTAFLAAAAIGVAARLPMAAFFAVAGIGLLIETPGWKRRCIVVTATAALAGLTIWLFAAGAWEQAWFWTVDFHRHVAYDRTLAIRLREFVATGPALWTTAGVALIAGFKGKQINQRTLALALVVAVLANLGRRTTYGEYVVPFVPVAGLIAAPWLADRFLALRPIGRAVLVACVALSAFILPPKISATALLDAAAATAALREYVLQDAYVLASMPELPVASGHKTYPRLALGKFAVTEDFPPDVAARMHLLTPDDLVALLEDERTVALALSNSWVWNFGWSVPSMRWISQAASDRIGAAILDRYTVVFQNNHYLILLRKDAPAAQPFVDPPSSVDEHKPASPASNALPSTPE